MELDVVPSIEEDRSYFLPSSAISCVLATMVQNVSKLEVKPEPSVLQTSFRTKHRKLLKPAERVKLRNMCKDVLRKKRECKPEVAKVAPSLNAGQDTVQWKGKRPEAASPLSTLMVNVRPEPVLTELLRPDVVEAAPPPVVSTSAYHVLAVDDSIVDQKVIEKLLKTSSYKVTTVDSALRALEVLGLSESCPIVANRLDINLIITDYCMPEMTGYDLLKRVKAQTSAWKDIPVIVMSSENDRNRIESCLADGAEEFIIKPVQMADVKRLRGHIRPLSRSSSSGSGESSSSSTICAKRKMGSPDALQVTTSPERRPRFSGVVVA